MISDAIQARWAAVFAAAAQHTTSRSQQTPILVGLSACEPGHDTNICAIRFKCSFTCRLLGEHVFGHELARRGSTDYPADTFNSPQSPRMAAAAAAAAPAFAFASNSAASMSVVRAGFDAGHRFSTAVRRRIQPLHSLDRWCCQTREHHRACSLGV